MLSNYAANKNGKVINIKTKRIIKMFNNGNGYLYFAICDKKRKNYYQHRFVYEVFKGKIPPNFEIDHLNNLKSDNRIKNLQLLTHKENIEKSKNKQIISISLKTGEKRRFDSIKKAGIELDISKSHICNICCNRKSNKTAKSKKDGLKYTFRYLD